jgi:hypothetical protein
VHHTPVSLAGSRRSRWEAPPPFPLCSAAAGR